MTSISRSSDVLAAGSSTSMGMSARALPCGPHGDTGEEQGAIFHPAAIFVAGNDKTAGENPTSGPGHGIHNEGDTIRETHGSCSAAVQHDFMGVTP